jgi:hypothetical protein
MQLLTEASSPGHQERQAPTFLNSIKPKTLGGSQSYLLEKFDVKAVRHKAEWLLEASEVHCHESQQKHTRMKTMYEDSDHLSPAKMVYLKNRYFNIHKKPGYQTSV